MSVLTYAAVMGLGLRVSVVGQMLAVVTGSR